MNFKMLQRWRRLDFLLAGKGVRVASAARELGVATKTIYRDLDAIARHVATDVVAIEERWGRRCWKYADPSRRLFNPLRKPQPR